MRTGRIVANVEEERVVVREVVAEAVLIHAHGDVGPRARLCWRRRRPSGWRRARRTIARSMSMTASRRARVEIERVRLRVRVVQVAQRLLQCRVVTQHHVVDERVEVVRCVDRELTCIFGSRYISN